jgi:hypothetical protein
MIRLTKIILWVVILAIVLPTCIGIAMGLVGTIVSIATSLLPLLMFWR